MPSTTVATLNSEAGQILKAIEANLGDFPHVEAERLELKTLTQEMSDLIALQDALNAKSQQATKDLNEKKDRSLVLFAQLRAAVRAKYGTRNEKLTEFRLRPLGGRRAPKPRVEAPKLPALASDPTPTTPNTTA